MWTHENTCGLNVNTWTECEHMWTTCGLHVMDFSEVLVKVWEYRRS